MNSGAMADIAFLLLIFFLVTTQILTNKGLTIMLPPKQPPDQQEQVEIKEKNLFKVRVNSNDALLVEGERMDLNNLSTLKSDAKEFILNRGEDPTLSDSPEDAIVSLKTNRGTSYDVYISVLDALQGAYYEIYADRAGISVDQWRKLNTKNPEDKEIYEDAREGIPMNISIAEPTDIGG